MDVGDIRGVKGQINGGILLIVKTPTRLVWRTFQGFLLFGAALTFYLFQAPSTPARAVCIVCLLAEALMLSRAAFGMDESRERHRFLLIQHFYMLGATWLLGLVVFW